MSLKPALSFSLALVLLWVFPAFLPAADIPDPEEFFGFRPGADYQMIRWEKIHEYFRLLDERSPRIEVEELGKTTLGNPFILATISSPDNLARRDEFREISRRLAGGRIPEEEAARLAGKGRTVALITCSMHATECGPTQMSPELGYFLATDDSPEVREILDNVILLLVPCWNPDGNIMVTDWYRENLGSPYERAPMPWLYHHYVGHDNNRDAFMHTQIETRYVNDILYHDWFPQIFMDMHHMGRSDARLFLSPLYEPRHHSLDPLLTREIELTGAYMRTVLEERNKIGVIHYANWNHWRMSAIHTCALWHNVATILFEAASTDLASPVFQTAEELTGSGSGGLGKQGNSQTINYPSPWPGGWWRLRDTVEYAYWSAVGFLESGAIHRSRYLLNMYRMARNSIEKGKTRAPFAYVVPRGQHDPGTVALMINTLIAGGIEFFQAEDTFRAQNREFPAGTYVAPAAQPYRPYLIDMLGPQIYPDRREYPGGPPERAFDLTGWTLPLQMGVEAVRVDGEFEARLKPIRRADPPTGKVFGNGPAYILDHAVLARFRAVNRLLKSGAEVYWASEPFTSDGEEYPAGSVVVDGSRELVEALAGEFHLRIRSASRPGALMRLKPLRLGLYQPWTANMDEGWTRWIFDTWEFPYTTLHDADIRGGRLRPSCDVIVLTNVDSRRMAGGHPEGTVPPRYAGGLGEAGLAGLLRFVEEGGTLVTLNASSRLPIDFYEAPVRDVSKSYPAVDFFCPSAILEVELDTAHPVAYGMGRTAAILSYGSPVFDIPGEDVPADVTVVARYPDRDPFLSGRLIGERVLRGRPALIELKRGKGRIIMFGFRPQNRAQTHGTFSLFFNALYYGSIREGARD